MLHKVGIIGYGFVGLATETGLQPIADVRIHDKYKDSESLDSAVNNSDIVFICVPTPMDEDGVCDTSIVESVAKKINSVATEKKTVVLKSTVPPHTTEELANCYGGHGWVFNPEFLTEKNFIQDFLTQDRIILGYASTCSIEDENRVKKLYEDFGKSQLTPAAKIYETTSSVAEMVKYTGNCFLATKVSLFNEIFEICKGAGLDYNSVIDLVTLDGRIGNSHIQVPGPDGMKGFGGKCFPKDINALMNFALDYDIDPMVLNSVWVKNLLVREKEDWKDIRGATTEKLHGDTKD